MCVMSMVYDHFDKVFPVWPPVEQHPVIPSITIGSFQIISTEEVESIRKLIAEFKEAVEAAKIVDRLTNQPDCEDPEKKKLEDRVTLLELEIEKLSKLKKE